ncbi:DUF211 domain-containing protein [Haloarchaeobius sp. HRN-SO-5]|uniref:DUF211 domain-containing protein n=1 Tax=Haloarchaeobius sp. HRN-SO-5 TaxID=3446118 RepID=UPI003EC12815
MAPVRRLVIDVLKPHEPPLVTFTQQLTDVDGIDGVTASLLELDQQVQNVKLTFEGASLEYETIREEVESLGATVHSVDEVACGETIVEDRRTPQDGL